jgi:hypothetical protein
MTQEEIAMNDPPRLSEAEWALITRLLEEERQELPSEIHHSQKSDYRDMLRRRQELVNGLLDRLQTVAAT